MNQDYSLLDANITRAREGLRALEDLCRFVLRHRVLSMELRKLRHELEAIEHCFPGVLQLLSRQGRDIGGGEPARPHKSILDYIMANGERVGQALRVLEEYSRLMSPGAVAMIGAWRYQSYSLVARLARSLPLFWLRVWTGEGLIYPIASEVNELEWLVRHGARIVQLRDKTNNERVVYEKSRQVCKFLSAYQAKTGQSVLFVVNDHIDIARRLPVSGVHIGEHDAPVEYVRTRLGYSKIIGRSNQTVASAVQAEKDGADYVGIGPIFATPTKVERLPIGLEAVTAMSKEMSIPWFAIGGINLQNIDEVRAAGAKNVAVIRSAQEFFQTS